MAQVGGCQRNRSWTTERLGKDHLKLTGQVEIECGEQSFAADEVELFTDTHKLIATGNVVFTSGTSRVAADRLEYNTETRTGIFHNATGTATLKESKPGPPQERSMFGTSEPDVYFYGKTLEKVGREKYKITSGGFTTCVQPAPRWQLTSGTVLLNLESHAILKNSLFRVKGVPVLYLPIFYYPVNKEDRSTGFLLPTYGTSTVRGQTISNAFFWAISRSQDATLLHDWYSTTGQGMGAEYRYMASPGSDGQIRFYNLREHEADYTDDGGAPVTTPERRSYEVRGAMSQRLGRKFRARGRADYFSDITVQQTYNQNIYDTSRRSRVYSGSVTGTVGSWNLSGAFDRNEFFYGTTQSTVRGGTPKVSAQRSDKPIFGSPAYFSMTVEGAKFTAQRKTATAVVDNGLSRFDIFPRVRVPFTKWQFLTVSTTAAARYTYWTERKDSSGLNVRRPDQPKLLRHGGAGERPDLQQNLESARQQVRGEDQALDRADLQRAADFGHRRLRPVRDNRRHRHGRRQSHPRELRGRQPDLPQARRRRPVDRSVDGHAWAELLHRCPRRAVRQGTTRRRTGRRPASIRRCRCRCAPGPPRASTRSSAQSTTPSSTPSAR